MPDPRDPLLERFNDLVLGCVPTLAGEVMQRALAKLQGPIQGEAVAGDRRQTAVLMPRLRPGPRSLAAAFSAALRQQLRDELARQPVAEPSGGSRKPVLSIDELTLVDDQQIEEDIEIARVIQQCDLAAESDWREMQALCATLRHVGEATAEWVPLRPEVGARSLSRALHALDLPREQRLLALRVVGGCLAERLETLVREQVRELRRWGVEPLPYQLRIAPELQHDAAPRDDAAMKRLAGQMAGEAAATAQLIPRLLQQVADQSGLDASLRALLQRLAGPAQRSASAEAGVLSSFQHPVWKLVDRFAALGAVQSARGAAAERLAAHLEPVIVRLEQTADASFVAYEQALAELDGLATDWADSQLAEAGFAVESATASGGSLPTDWGGEGSLPTVPMALPGTADPHQAWLDALREGDWLRLFLHAQWHTAQLSGRSSGHLLLATRAGEPLHTLSRAALLRLRESGLATRVESIAPVRQAVDTLTLDLDA